MEMIRLEHVTKSFGEHTVLDDFSISIPEGEFLTVIGRSGCGKTTMLKMINGLNCPEKGKVYIGGKDIGEENIIELRRKIGYVIQNKGLFPHMTVEKNITYVPVISGKKDKKTNHELACRLIETVGLDQSMLSRYPSELSGGQQQRVLLARALCATDSVLILDEPVTGLDPAASMELYETIKDLNKKENVTIIMVSHDIKNALNYATHILHLEQEKDFFGTVEEYKKSNVSNMFLGGAAND